ncbi:MAG: hypothetical protein SGI74_03095 [Oligoflexia bacterium]|nr:hypothetical protein [Oligoflexia bacterium]
MTKLLSTTVFAFLIFNLFSVDAEARKKKRSKLNIVVNQILKLDGTLTRNGEPAPEFSGVKDGDLLETGERSVAIIKIPGLGLFRMGSQTKFRMTKFQGRDLTRLELIGGDITVLFKRLGDHEMILPRGVIEPLGASFKASTDAKEIDNVVLCSGKLKLKAFTKAEENERAAEANPKPKGKKSSLTKINQTAIIGMPVVAAPVVTTASATPAPTDTPSDKLPTEITLTLESESKYVQLVDQGLEIKPKGEIISCNQKLMADLESLYGLP